MVYHDVVGLFKRFTPKFVKQYITLGPMVVDALRQYKREVEGALFPGEEHTFKMSKEEAEKL